ncbi:MAG: hypothetical protein ABSE90_07200 [Verrucomicrobiota bacterium]
MNLANFADPFFNVLPDERPEMEMALQSLVQSGEVFPDRLGGWMLANAKSGENHTVKKSCPRLRKFLT